ncbi:hypothetical protein OIU78_024581 [Salix suchowensis]|nr:hypothetical protein OIU78_024581 [Salix suchowensis]
MVPSTAVAEDSVAVLGCHWMLKLGHDAGAKRFPVVLEVEDSDGRLTMLCYVMKRSCLRSRFSNGGRYRGSHWSVFVLSRRGNGGWLADELAIEDDGNGTARIRQWVQG